MQKHVLGIDVGTGGTRAVIVDENGRLLVSATEEHEPFASPRIGWAEQRPEDWWRAAGIAVRKALALGKLRGDQIACVGFSGQMHGAVMLDSSDKVVRPALIWCDVRTDKQCKDLNERIGAARLIQLTCNPALANLTLTKLLWMRENEPENWRRVSSVILPKDYVRLKLTGERATDLVDASGTLMLDVARRQWSGEVLQAMGLDESLLPSLYESPEVCGEISVMGAEATGLAAGTPVVARRRGPSRRSHRYGDCRAGRRERHDRNFWSSFCGDGPTSARSGRPLAYFLPCNSGPLACDGSYAGGRSVASMVP